MRRAALAIVTTIAGLVLLLGFKTHAVPSTANPPAALSTTGTTAAKSVTGSAAATRWGPVQVQVSIVNKTITKVTVLQAPSSNGRDQQINSRALPELEAETLAAQSADIDMVSGATYTSSGYIASLQSALDKAGG